MLDIQSISSYHLDMLEINDEVVIKDPHWHEGENIGGRLGRVISLKGYVLVRLYDYKSNPVKCFRSEVKKVIYDDEENSLFTDDEDLDRWYDNIFRT